MVKEAETFDGASLTAAKVIMNEVLQAFNTARTKAERIPPSTLDALSRALERSQRVGRLAMNMPTELMDQAKAAEEAAAERRKAAGDPGDAMTEVLDRLSKLEGEEYLRALDAVFGPTPAGSGPVIQIPRRDRRP